MIFIASFKDEKKHPSSDLKEKIVQLYFKGKSPASLSLDFGYNKSTIHRWIDSFKKNQKIERVKNPGSGRPSKIDEVKGQKLLQII